MATSGDGGGVSARDVMLYALSRYFQPADIVRLTIDDVASEYDGHWDAHEQVRLANGRVVSFHDKREVVQSIEAFLNAEPEGRPFVDYHPGCVPWLFASSTTSRCLHKRKLRECLHRIRSGFVTGAPAADG